MPDDVVVSLSHAAVSQTDRQTDRETDRQADRQTNRQTERETDRQADRHTDKGTGAAGVTKTLAARVFFPAVFSRERTKKRRKHGRPLTADCHNRGCTLSGSYHSFQMVCRPLLSKLV